MICTAPMASPRRVVPSILPRLSRAACALLAALVAACTEDGDTVAPGAQESPASAGFLLGDATVDGLSAFDVELLGLRLEREDGTLTDELLSTTLRVELTGLAARSRLIADAEFPSGTYAGAFLLLGPEARALRSDGVPVEVDERSVELAAPFPELQEIEPFTRITIAIDFDLARSLAGDPFAGPIVLLPQGSSAIVPAGATVPLDEFDALVVDRDTGTLALILVPFADGDRRVPLDALPADLEPTAILVDREGFVFDQAAFFYTLLVPGLSIVHVEARAEDDGSLSVVRLELEDQDGGATPVSTVFPVALEGTVVGGIPGVSFQLAVREIERGSTVAAPVLLGLPDPLTVQVAFDQRTLVFASSFLVPSVALRVGHEVKVRFESFSSPPFFAARVSILHPLPTSSGRIVAVDDLPQRFELELAEGDPLLRAGLVARSTAVEVVLDSASIVLETAGAPRLVADELVNGLFVRVSGFVSGPPDGAQLSAASIRVRPTRVVGATVTTISEVQGFFMTIGGTDPDEPGDVGMQDILLDPDAVFLGAATSSTEFFDLFDTLGENEELEVDVEGIPGTVDGVLNAFAVESRVR